MTAAKSSSTDPLTAPHQEASLRTTSRRRQTLTLLFALMLVLVAAVTSAQEPQAVTETAQLPAPASPASSTLSGQPAPSDNCLYCATQGCGTGATVHTGCPCVACHVYLSVGEPIAAGTRIPDHISVIEHSSPAPMSITGGAVPQRRHSSKSRPAYAELFASLGNFDADAEPDGWRAEVVLLDDDDQPIVMRANATFELMPRVAAADHQQYVDGQAKPIRWSMPLEFNEHAVAKVRLPLRDSLRPMLGWSSALHPAATPRNLLHGDRTHRTLRPRIHSSHRNFVTQRLRDRIVTPNVAELRVRVSVPTEGVFEAVAIVPLRPSVLVDTNWPYR